MFSMQRNQHHPLVYAINATFLERAEKGGFRHAPHLPQLLGEIMMLIQPAKYATRNCRAKRRAETRAMKL